MKKLIVILLLLGSFLVLAKCQEDEIKPDIHYGDRNGLGNDPE